MYAAAPWISFLMTKQQMNNYFDQVREIRYSHLILQFSSFILKTQELLGSSQDASERVLRASRDCSWVSRFEFVSSN